jgi:hypothetical protein
MMVPELERGGVPVLVARTRVETTAHARRAGKTTFFRHQAMTARTGAGILVAASLDARAPRSPDPPCPPPRPRLRPIWRLIPPRARAPQLSPAHTLQWFMERKRERERDAALVGWLRQFSWPCRRRRLHRIPSCFGCACSAFYPPRAGRFAVTGPVRYSAARSSSSSRCSHGDTVRNYRTRHPFSDHQPVPRGDNTCGSKANRVDQII